MAKADVIAEAVEMGLGTEEELDALTVAEIKDLMATENGYEPGPAIAAPVEKAPANMTTVDDLIKNGSIKVAGK